MTTHREITVRPLSPERLAAMLAKPRPAPAPEEPTKFSHLADRTILRMATPGTKSYVSGLANKEDADAVEIEMGRRNLYGN